MNLKNIPVKCVAWDLDNTLFNGVVTESNNIRLKKNVKYVLKMLDERGILQSIVSKNDFDVAYPLLKKFNIDHYFLYPQISWLPKSTSITKIAQSLNIGIDTFAFIDDQKFEREEVLYHYPKILCFNGSLNLDQILHHPRMNPNFITNESKERRIFYSNDIRRKSYESEFQGSNEKFLNSLNLNFNLKNAEILDLKRCEELIIRTNQLNTTGVVYSYKELKALLKSPNHFCVVGNLLDKFGEYGTVLLSIIKKTKNAWNLSLLVISCRVLSRGIGPLFLNYFILTALRNDKIPRIEYIPSKKNRIMLITIKLSGFKEIKKSKSKTVFEYYLKKNPSFPKFISLHSNADF